MPIGMSGSAGFANGAAKLGSGLGANTDPDYIWDAGKKNFHDPHNTHKWATLSEYATSTFRQDLPLTFVRIHQPTPKTA
jgi:hypothetical protein